jgi:hypothetical protein
MLIKLSTDNTVSEAATALQTAVEANPCSKWGKEFL